MVGIWLVGEGYEVVERVLDDGGELAEIAIALLQGGRVAQGIRTQRDRLVNPGHVEPRAVLDDRSAEIGIGLVQDVWRLPGAGRLGEGLGGVQRGVLVLVVCRGVPIVGAVLGDHVEAGGARIIRAAGDLVHLNGFEERGIVELIAGGVVGHTIHLIGLLVAIGYAGHDQVPAVALDTGHGRHQGKWGRVDVHHRPVEELFLVEFARNGAVLSLDQLSATRYRDRLGCGAHL